MSLQQDRQVDRRASSVECLAHYCDACSGPMRIVMATPSVCRSGARSYHCEYLCDCGYREIFEEEL